MYKLYGNNRGMKLLDVSQDETDIVDTLGSYMGCLDTINYIVIESKKDTDSIRAVIKNYDDYVNYKYQNDKPKIKTR